MRTVIVRLDIDRYDLLMIERLVMDKVLTICEAREGRAVKALGDWQEVVWVRKMQGLVNASVGEQVSEILELYREMSKGA